MNRYEVLNEAGAVVNTIIADKVFVDVHYPLHRLVIEPPTVISKDEKNAMILAQIAALEAGQMRGMREFMLNGSTSGLKSLDDKISTLRAQLEK